MKNIIFLISVLLMVASCDNKADYSTPAQGQIDKYTSTLKECKESEKNKNVTATPAVTAQPPQSTPIPVQQQTENVPAPDFLNIQKGDIVLGDPQSKIVVVEYFSPTCTHCAYYHKAVLPEIKNKYIDTNKIVYVIREFISNKQDLDAAILARCLQNQDHFIKFTEVLLQQQASWGWNKNYREILTNIGKLGGLSEEEYEKCLNDETLIAGLVSNSKMVFKSSKFIGTPAFFINGVQFTKPYTVKDLSEAIDKASETP